ncbi:MAG: glycosyltransferase family 1 protein [bacterium]|nr:glycosyltransferase family 1 protein [bacterium]
MVIGIDASRANRRQKSGVEWYAYNLLDRLFELDHNNQYLLYTPDKLRGAIIPRSANWSEEMLNWPLNRFWTLGRLSWEMICHQPDILFVPSHTFPLVRAKKNVITWHDVGYEHYPETYGSFELKSLKLGAKRMVKTADQIIAVSDFTKREIMKFYGVDSQRIAVVPLGLDHRLWQPSSPESVKETLNQLKIKYPYFVFLSRLSLRKNVIGLVRIYNRFRETQQHPFNLLLVGSDQPGAQELDAEIKASPYKEEIKKLGWLEIQQLPVLLSGARALLFPSIYEGFGLPAIEAMACGTPVIASNSGALPETVNNAGMLIDTHDYDAFAASMVKVVEDSDFRQGLINRGLARAQEYSWDQCAKQTLDVLLN